MNRESSFEEKVRTEMNDNMTEFSNFISKLVYHLQTSGLFSLCKQRATFRDNSQQVCFVSKYRFLFLESNKVK